MNVLIYPTYDPYGLALTIKHYCHAGHNVFVLKHSAVGANHSTSAYWPAYMCKSLSDKSKRNIEVYGFNPREDWCWGEDNFLRSVDLPPLYGDNVACDFIDPATFKQRIDIVHTLRGGEPYLRAVKKITRVYFPNAKWVSSTLNCWDHNPLLLFPSNIAKIIPANYEEAHKGCNSFCLMGDEFVLKLLGVRDELDREGFASFHNNLHEKSTRMYSLLEEANSLLTNEKIENFGGNCKFGGADVRKCRSVDPSRTWVTLNPIEQAKKIASLKGLVILRDYGYGDRLFHQALALKTPVITTREYVNASNAGLYLRAGLNCILADTPQELAKAVKWLAQDDEMFFRLSRGMEQVKNSVFDDSYWSQWRVFLERTMR